MKRILLVLAALLALGGTHSASAQGYVVVVNAASSASSISKSDLSNVFLKKSSRFAPVDLAQTSPVRDAFSKAVHGRPAAAIASHWQQQIFAGKDVPPATKSSDADVIAYVRGAPNGIGYVSAGATLGSGVKAIAVQ